MPISREAEKFRNLAVLVRHEDEAKVYLPRYDSVLRGMDDNVWCIQSHKAYMYE